MNNMENSSRIQSEELRHPGDVFMMFATDGKVQVTSANGRFFRSFEHFSIHCATALLNQMRPRMATAFLSIGALRIPHPCGPETKTFRSTHAGCCRPFGTRACGRVPRDVSIHCSMAFKRGCDTRQMADLYDNPDYLERVRLYEGSNVEERPLSYRGIETDAGVLLFNSTPRGESLYGDYLRFLADHLNHPCMELTYVRTLELLPDETLRSKVNPPVDVLGSGSMEMLGCRPSVYHAERDQLGIYTELRRFDLAPGEANFVRLSRFAEYVFNAPKGGKIRTDLSSEKAAKSLEIIGDIEQSDSKMCNKERERRFPDVAERLARLRTRKKGLVR